jgi:hypothetical protein
MRDSRFRSSTPTLWPALIAQGRLVEGKSWFPPLLSQMSSVVSQAGCQGDRDVLVIDSSILSGQWTLLHSEEIGVPADILNALERSLESPPTDEATAEAAWCWGVSLGNRASNVVGEKELRRLLNTASRNVVMEQAFLECAARLLHEKKQPLWAAMNESVEHLVVNPGDFAVGMWGEVFAKTLEVWEKKFSYEAFDLTALERVPFHYEFIGLIDQLRTIDRLEYLSWLEHLRNPLAIRDALLSQDIVEDFDELLTLLDTAPPAYGPIESDGWTCPIAPMLLEVALQHVTRLLAPFSRTPRDEVVYKCLCDDLFERMDSLAQTIARRADGPRLVADWLMRLVRMKTQLSAWAALPASMAMKAMIQIFGSTEERATTVIQWFPYIPALSKGELQELRGTGVGRISIGITPQVDVLVARLSMKGFRQDTKSFDDELRLYENLSLLRDPGLHDVNFDELPTWRHQLVSCVFLGTDPVVTWKRHWGQLEEQRLRSRHSTFTNDHSADDASLFLCAAAISLLGRTEKGSTLVLWTEVHDAIWFMTLLYGSLVGGRNWRYLFALLVGTLPRHLDLTSAIGIDRLSAIVKAFAGDEELIIQTVAQVFRTGIASGSLMNAVAQAKVDLRSTLKRFEQHADNVHIYSLSKYWKDAGTICNQILGPSVG